MADSADKESKTENPTEKKLRDAIEGLDILTYTGQTKYSAKDHVGLTPDWIAIDTVKDGNFIATDYSVAKFKELLK